MTLVIRALATWRLTHMFMYEAGPGNVLRDFRAGFGVRHAEDGIPMAYPDGSVFSCFLCFSVWVGVVAGIAPTWLVKMLALSALAIWAEWTTSLGLRRGQG